jgi:hypothetical protein
MDDNSNCLKARKTQGDKNGVPDSCTPCGFESVWAVPNKAKFVLVGFAHARLPPEPQNHGSKATKSSQ